MCDGEPLDFHAPEKWVTARKLHRCSACGEAITPGYRYHYLTGRFEGEWVTWKHCARCWMMLEILSYYSDGQTIQLDLDCGEDWESLTGEPPPDDVAELAFLSANDAQERVREIGAEK